MAAHNLRLDEAAAAALAEALARIDGPADMRRLLGDLLTPAELHDLSLRWRLLQLLEAGVSQRRIAETLGVSLCKITRGSRVLKQTGSVTARILRQTHSNGAQ